MYLEPIDEDIYENDELRHWGIIGMKWGIRRYQNEDGTLTPEGKERYRKNLQKSTDRENKTGAILDRANNQFNKVELPKINAKYEGKNLLADPKLMDKYNKEIYSKADEIYEKMLKEEFGDIANQVYDDEAEWLSQFAYYKYYTNLLHSDIYENDELKHFGILGMHWGIRRYQNPDGTLTEEGKQRYLKTGSDGKKTLTEEGYKQFFNKENQESTSGKAKNIGLIGGLIGAGTVAGSFTPMGAAGGAAIGSALAIAAGFAAMDPNTKKGLTKEGGKFFYDTDTGQLTDEAKQMIFDDTTFLTDLGARWITEQYDPAIHPEVKSSPEYKVAKMSKEMNQELNTYIAKNIMPICKDMSASVYLEEQWNYDNRSKEADAYYKYAEQLSKKYYDRAMKELK